MRKIISIILLFVLYFLIANANQNVIVSAVVGSLNRAPLVLSVNPNSNPRILKVNRTQSYTLYFSDNEKDIVHYTITPISGYSNPISGVINTSNYDSNNGAYINFLYLAPATAKPNEKVIITLNDGPNVVVKELNLYIY